MTPKNLIFLHIPKTAGITFNQVLENQYGKENVILLPSISNNKKDTATLKPLKDRDIVYRGHINYGLHHELDQGGKYLVFLRDPIGRVKSFYRYIKQNKTHYLHDRVMQDKMTINDFIDSGISTELDNGQLRMIVGKGGSREKLSQKDVQFAKRVLSEEAYFGITSHFDESLILFRELLGWNKLPVYFRRNETRSVKQDETIEVHDKFIEANKFDLDLYEWAQGVFSTRLEEFSYFNQELEKFKEANIDYNNLLSTRLKKSWGQAKDSVKDKIRF